MAEVNKVLGYVLAIAGLFGIVISVSTPIRDKIFSFLPEAASSVAGKTLVIASIILLAVGVVLVSLTSRGSHTSQKEEEVPIYKGKEIIGYRRKK